MSCHILPRTHPVGQPIVRPKSADGPLHRASVPARLAKPLRPAKISSQDGQLNSLPMRTLAVCSQNHLRESECERSGRIAAEIGNRRDGVLQIEDLEGRVIGSTVDGLDEGARLLNLHFQLAILRKHDSAPQTKPRVIFSGRAELNVWMLPEFFEYGLLVGRTEVESSALFQHELEGTNLGFVVQANRGKILDLALDQEISYGTYGKAPFCSLRRYSMKLRQSHTAELLTARPFSVYGSCEGSGSRSKRPGWQPQGS